MKYDSTVTAEWARNEEEAENVQAIVRFLTDLDAKIKETIPYGSSITFGWGTLKENQAGIARESLEERGFVITQMGAGGSKENCALTW